MLCLVFCVVFLSNVIIFICEILDFLFLFLSLPFSFFFSVFSIIQKVRGAGREGKGTTAATQQEICGV